MAPRSASPSPAGTLLNGPLHNNLPDPATAGRGTDNNSFWVPDFSPGHYNKLIYTKTGLTQRVRPDLTGPDGRPGVDLRGYTVKNHYREMSKGAYDITGSRLTRVKYGGHLTRVNTCGRLASWP